jgi:predicted aconitase
MRLTDQEKAMRDGAEGAAVAAAMDLLVRYGEAAVPVDDFAEWGMLGYFTGALVGEERPVVTGRLGRPDLAELKHFGAAAATSGGVELYHLPGITPEAPTVEAAFGPAPVPAAISYGPHERRQVYEDLNSQGTSTDVDFVLLGCPHASVGQIREAAAALDGRRLSPGTHLWLMVPARSRSSPTAAATPRRSNGPAGRCSPIPVRRCRGPHRPVPGSSPPTRRSRPTTRRRSSASRHGSARSRSVWTPP